MRHSIWFAPLLVAGFCVLAFRSSRDDIASQVVISLAMTVLAFGFTWSGYRKYLRWAANHILIVSEDALHFQDGSTDLRVPFTSIATLAIKRRHSKVHGIILKHDSERKLLHGYDNLDALAQLLTARIPPDRIKEFAWFHV